MQGLVGVGTSSEWLRTSPHPLGGGGIRGIRELACAVFGMCRYRVHGPRTVNREIGQRNRVIWASTASAKYTGSTQAKHSRNDAEKQKHNVFEQRKETRQCSTAHNNRGAKHDQYFQMCNRTSTPKLALGFAGEGMVYAAEPRAIQVPYICWHV